MDWGSFPFMAIVLTALIAGMSSYLRGFAAGLKTVLVVAAMTVAAVIYGWYVARQGGDLAGLAPLSLVYFVGLPATGAGLIAAWVGDKARRGQKAESNKSEE